MSYEESSAIGSLSDSTIRRQLLADAVRHPATLLPLAMSTASGVYALVLSPVLGGGLWAIVLLIVSGAVAAATFGWRYVFDYPREYAERARDRELVRLEREVALSDLHDRRLARSEQEEIKQLRAVLQSGFSRIDSAAGSRAVGALADEYDRLLPALRRRADVDPLLTSLVSGLAEEAYRSGLNVLSDALELMKVTGTGGRERLEWEIAELERGVECSEGDGSQAEQLGIKGDTLASHRERLEMLDQLQLSLVQLLFQTSRCEASLHRARIEVATIRPAGSESGMDSVIEALQETIDQVKQAQDERKRLG